MIVSEGIIKPQNSNKKTNSDPKNLRTHKTMTTEPPYSIYTQKKTYISFKKFSASKTKVLLILLLSFLCADYTSKKFISRCALHTHAAGKCECWTRTIYPWTEEKITLFCPNKQFFFAADSSQTKIKPFFLFLVRCHVLVAMQKTLIYTYELVKVCLILPFSLLQVISGT